MSQELSFFSENVQQVLTNLFKSEGVNLCKEYLKRMNKEGKAGSLKVGIIGEAGSGKSSFNNTMRGLKADSPGAAPVGVTEATICPTEYLHPNHKMLAFWDLPGVGTPLFPKDDYLKKIEVDRYDCFILITEGRFKENDLWLANEISKRKKHFYFVRSKIDIDVMNDKRDVGKNHDEEKLLQKIRTHTIESLKKGEFNDPVYLIDSTQRSKYDFDKLEETVIENLPDLKRQAMILSLTPFIESMIKTKVEKLRERIPNIAKRSALVALCPIPVISIAFDKDLLLSELQFFYHQLGLDEVSLEQRSDLMKVDKETLKKILVREFPMALGDDVFVTLAQKFDVSAYDAAPSATDRKIKVYKAIKTAGEFIKVIPFVGTLIGGAMSSPSSHSFSTFALNHMLDKMEIVSLELTKYYLAEYCRAASMSSGSLAWAQLN